MRRGAGVHSLKLIISLNQGSLNRVSDVLPREALEFSTYHPQPTIALKALLLYYWGWVI